MGGSGYGVQADVLKEQGGAFGRIAADFAKRSKQFDDALKALEDGWGEDDVIGVTVALDMYKAASGGILDSLEHLGDGLKGIGEKLTSNANLYEQAEQGNEDALRQIGQ
ncbi:WXG100 family type VII secretion target [Streptomyces fractus]|uniref:WXG100 family type VII secretion target n=1 Tax=Streptomyces fractus TaxID=641806 RepID=UPI003CF2C581